MHLVFDEVVQPQGRRITVKLQLVAHLAEIQLWGAIDIRERSIRICLGGVPLPEPRRCDHDVHAGPHRVPVRGLERECLFGVRD